MDTIIVFKGKINNNDILIRYPESSDAKQMMVYINSLSDERTFITYQGEHETLESETKFLNQKLKSIYEKTAVMLLAFAKERLVGISGVELGIKTNRHIGTFQISVAKEYRGKGIGKKLLKITEDESIKNLPGLEILILGVFSCNIKAKEMYVKAGYIKEGMLPRGIKLENGYDDHIYMYKNVK